MTESSSPSNRDGDPASLPGARETTEQSPAKRAPSAASSDEAAGEECETADSAGDARSFLGLTRWDVRFLLTSGAVVLVLSGLHWLRLTGRGASPVEIDRLGASSYQFTLDINTATWVEWMQLEGIGETLARRIVADREERGPFTGIDDVQRVKGIGPRKLDAIRRYLVYHPRDSENAH